VKKDGLSFLMLNGFPPSLTNSAKAKRPGYVTKHVLRKLALRRWPSVMADVVLNTKYELLTRDFPLSKFSDMCERNLPDGYVERHQYRCAFPSKQELLLFDLFTRIFLEQRGAEPDELDIFEFVKEKAERKSLLADDYATA
jgi:hypothetical protein